MSAKVPIGEQIAAVAQSASLAEAGCAYHKQRSGTDDPAQLARVAALHAAVATLTFMRDNRDRIVAAVAGGRRDAAGAGAADANSADKERRPFAALPLAQQAALRCADARFQKFMRAKDAEEAAAAVRQSCGVASRAELDTDRRAAEAWRGLDAMFLARVGGQGKAGEGGAG